MHLICIFFFRLKQLEDTKSKIVDNMREMSKPVARYKDDSDLDAFLKAQEREGDPMLDYIRKKQSESHPVQKCKLLLLVTASSCQLFSASYYSFV